MKHFLLVATLLATLSFQAFAQTVIVKPDNDAQLVDIGVTGSKSNVLFNAQTVAAGNTKGTIIGSYTVSANKTLYLDSLSFAGLVVGATTTTAMDLGRISLESPAGTKVISGHLVAYQGFAVPLSFRFSAPVPFSSGTVLKVVLDNLSSASSEYDVNFVGFER